MDAHGESLYTSVSERALSRREAVLAKMKGSNG
jgi:hypothetical protein